MELLETKTKIKSKGNGKFVQKRALNNFSPYENLNFNYIERKK
jgi:hypothetical protein